LFRSIINFLRESGSLELDRANIQGFIISPLFKLLTRKLVWDIRALAWQWDIETGNYSFPIVIRAWRIVRMRKSSLEHRVRRRNRMDVVFKAEARSKPVRTLVYVRICVYVYLCVFSYPARATVRRNERQPLCRKRRIQNHTVILFPAFTRSLRSP